jgi:hypothetical protein
VGEGCLCGVGEVALWLDDVGLAYFFGENFGEVGTTLRLNSGFPNDMGEVSMWLDFGHVRYILSVDCYLCRCHDL